MARRGNIRAGMAALALLTAGGAQAELVTNGSFVDGQTGWSFVSNAFVDVGSYGIPAGNPAAVLGSSFSFPGRLEQTLATVVGQTYDLEFSYWGFGNNRTLDLELTVLGAGVLLQDTRSTSGYTTPSDPSGYFQMSYSFTADTTSTVLRFIHRNTDTALHLDDVSVTARVNPSVPEPGTWALAGLALVLASRARRR